MCSNYFTILDYKVEKKMMTFEKLQKFLTKSLNSGKHKFETLEVGDDGDNWVWEFEVDGKRFKLEELFEEDESFCDRLDEIEERLTKLENPDVMTSQVTYAKMCPECSSTDIDSVPCYNFVDWLGYSKDEYKCNSCGHRWGEPYSSTTTIYSSSCNGDCNCKKEGE